NGASTPGSTANLIANTQKSVHVQLSSVTDQTGALGPVQRCCVESDLIGEGNNEVFVQPQFYSHRQRPYVYRAPIELGPRWTAGLIKPLPGQAPVSLVAEWEVQTEDRTFKIAACGRSIYWSKDLWDQDSQFGDSSVWLFGGYGSHLFVRASASQLGLSGTATKTTVVFEAWLKPLRLDGRRMV